MAVLNVTPDSFSDAGRYFAPEAAVQQGLRLLEEGADILDVGGESTRPGAAVAPPGEPVAAAPAVTAEEELRRVRPVIKAIQRAAPEAVISIDTYKAAVAREAVRAGAQIVNDVSGLRWDPAMAATVAELGCGLVLMHMRGRPEQWSALPRLSGDDLLALVARELAQAAGCAEAAGIARESIVLDPGFGFGKSYEENYPLLARLGELHRLGFPLLAGTSRKSFIGKTSTRGGLALPPEERLAASLASMTAAILQGAHIVRVHDVRASVQAAALADAILNAGKT
jgi:dihydropteroate synthase